MKEIELQFLKLIRGHLHGESAYDIPKEMLPTLWEMAVLHQVEGIVSEQLLSSNTISKQISIQLMSYQQNLSAMSKSMANKIVSLHHLCQEEGISTYLVKGHANASLYPKPELRTIGDIDFFCPNPEDISRIVEIMNKAGYTIYDDPHDNKDLHKAIQLEDFMVEFHGQLLYIPRTDRNRVFDHYSRNLLENEEPAYLKIGEECIQILPPEVRLIHIFLHFFGDLLGGWANLKHLIDWYISLVSLKNSVNQERLQSFVEEMHLTNQVKIFGEILVRWLGIDESDLLWDRPKPSRLLEKNILALEKIYFDTTRNPKLYRTRDRKWSRRARKYEVILRQNWRFRNIAGYYAWLFPTDMLIHRIKETFRGAS